MSVYRFRDNPVIRYFSDPFIFISTLGPAFIESNYAMVKSKVSEISINEKFKDLIENDYNYAFTSYNIQLFVLYLAMIFLVVESASCFSKMYHNKDDNLTKVQRNLTTVTVSLFWFLVIGFTISWLYGGFAGYRTIDHYLKKNTIYIFGFIPSPPFSSIITIWRLVLIPFYGILFAAWRHKVYVKLVGTKLD